MTVATTPFVVTGATIPVHRAQGLRRWNIVLAALHAGQAGLILFLSFVRDPMVTSPVTIGFLRYDDAVQTLVNVQRPLFDLPIGPAVALFFLLSALAHVAVAFPFRAWYERSLARGQNPARWIEYALSSSVMIVVIATLAGIADAGALLAVFGINAAMNLFGWSMESANEGRIRVQWNHYVFGCIAGAVPWIAIALALWAGATEPGAQGAPAFVYVIFVSLFLSFNVFAITMVLQYRKVGRWRDHLVGERTYMILSLVAKTLLAWQVFAGTLAP